MDEDEDEDGRAEKGFFASLLSFQLKSRAFPPLFLNFSL